MTSSFPLASSTKMSESSDSRVPRVYLCLMVFLNGTTPASDHASDNGLNLTEDAALPQTTFPTARSWTLLTLRRRKYEGSLGAGFITYETTLLTRTYLGGQRCTLADITAASVIFLSVFHSLDALLRAGQPNIFLATLSSLGNPTGETEKAEEDVKEDTNVVPEESKLVISYRHRRPVSSTRDALISNTMLRARWLSPWFYEDFRKESFSIYLIDQSHLEIVLDDSIITGALMLWGQDVRPVVEVALDYEGYNYKKLDLENFEVNTFEVF
ncbi:hypothetical protein EDC04DRAFT_3093102 [Pisolithus marmoratus]|nr:hypothetical protein EDC04DRAFT_3093102 [Pisolithus marmoratus]